MTGTFSANFQFMAIHDLQLVRLAALAERYFADDPNTSLIKLRQFGELLAQQVAARYRMLISSDEFQAVAQRRTTFHRDQPPLHNLTYSKVNP